MVPSDRRWEIDLAKVDRRFVLVSDLHNGFGPDFRVVAKQLCFDLVVYFPLFLFQPP